MVSSGNIYSLMAALCLIAIAVPVGVLIWLLARIVWAEVTSRLSGEATALKLLDARVAETEQEVRARSLEDARAEAFGLLAKPPKGWEVDTSPAATVPHWGELPPTLREFFTHVRRVDTMSWSVSRDQITQLPRVAGLQLGTHISGHDLLCARPGDDRVSVIGETADLDVEQLPSIFHWLVVEARTDELLDAVEQHSSPPMM